MVPDFKGQLAVMKAAARAVLAREEIGVLDNWIDCQEGTVHVHYGIGHAPLAAALRESVRASAGTREWLVAATRDQALARLDKAIAAEFPTPATAPAAPAAPAAPVAEDPYARCPRPPWFGGV